MRWQRLEGACSNLDGLPLLQSLFQPDGFARYLLYVLIMYKKSLWNNAVVSMGWRLQPRHIMRRIGLQRIASGSSAWLGYPVPYIVGRRRERLLRLLSWRPRLFAWVKQGGEIDLWR
jgi:hypothetical protein